MNQILNDQNNKTVNIYKMEKIPNTNTNGFIFNGQNSYILKKNMNLISFRYQCL